jgi:pimeloyl-ACP methyl ester carboxylesterase
VNNIQSNKITVDDLDVNYYTAGHGEPLVVIHGGGGDARTWSHNIEALAENYTVYAPDLPGYGASQPLIGDYYIPELTGFVNNFSRNLGLNRFNLVGHSLGGGIALNYALEFPQRVKKLVLVSSLCLGSEIAFWVRLLSVPALLRSVGAMTMAVLKSIKWILDTLVQGVEFIMPLSPASVTIGGSITTLHQQTLVLANRLSEIIMPTLLVWGGRDPIVPVQHAYAAAEVIPDCRLKVFENRGHNVHRDELSQFSSVLTDFLR